MVWSTDDSVYFLPQPFDTLLVNGASSNVTVSISPLLFNHQPCHLNILHAIVTSDSRWKSILACINNLKTVLAVLSEHIK